MHKLTATIAIVMIAISLTACADVVDGAVEGVTKLHREIIQKNELYRLEAEEKYKADEPKRRKAAWRDSVLRAATQQSQDQAQTP